MEEESVPCRRSDGSVVPGLTCSEWESYLVKYSNVSEQELTDLRDLESPNFNKRGFEIDAEMADVANAKKKRLGIRASLASPLFMLLSIEIKPVDESKLSSVYGEITSHGYFDGKRDYIYNRQFHDAENVGCDGGYLTLNGPRRSCSPYAAHNILSSRKLSVKLYQAHGILVDTCIELRYSNTELEQVAIAEIHSTGSTLIVKYVSIPMASYGRLELNFHNKSNSERKSVQVYGKVVAKYKNTYGGYRSSEEIVLFKKNPDEYETVVVGPTMNLLFPSRHWLAIPTYSSLLVHLDLFEFGTNQPILKQEVELEVETGWGFSKDLVTTEFIISVFASWFSSYPPVEFKDGDDSCQKECEDADDSIQGEPMDGGGYGVQISRTLRSCTILHQFSAFEVFSILICHKKCLPLTIHGLLRVTFDFDLESPRDAINIFKQDKEDPPLSLSGRCNTIPVSDGSRRRQNSDSLSVICDLKDTLGKLSIKGYQGCSYDRCLYPDRPLCSIIRGDHGFAALHYAIFTSAVQANLKVFYTENGFEGVSSPVLGSFFAEYNNFDCQSGLEDNRYKIVLFERIRKKDSVQVCVDGSIPLSRSSFVVPSSSSFTLHVGFIIGTQKFSGKETIKTKRNMKSDTISMSIKLGKGEVKIHIEWSEVQ